MLPDLYRTTQRIDIPDRGLAAREGEQAEAVKAEKRLQPPGKDMGS